MSWPRYLILAGLAAAGGGWLAWHLKPEPKVPPVVQLDPAAMEAERVAPKPGILERVELGRVKPTQTRIATAPSPAGRESRDRYCAPVQTSAKTDSGSSPSMNRKPVLPDFGGRAGRGKLQLQSTLSDGRRWGADYKVRGRWTWISSGDTVIVRSERLWPRLFRGLGKCALAGAAGGGAGWLLDGQRGAILGASVGCGTTIAF